MGPPSTEAALSALERASASEPSGVPEDMAFLIELVQGSKSRAERWRQAAALMGLRSILLCKHQAVRVRGYYHGGRKGGGRGEGGEREEAWGGRAEEEEEEEEEGGDIRVSRRSGGASISAQGCHWGLRLLSKKGEVLTPVQLRRDFSAGILANMLGSPWMPSNYLPPPRPPPPAPPILQGYSRVLRFSESHGSGRVGSGGVHNITDRVWSSREVSQISRSSRVAARRDGAGLVGSYLKFIYIYISYASDRIGSTVVQSLAGRGSYMAGEIRVMWRVGAF